MKHSKSSLFLMELIISILFFSMASTVCIRLFVRAHTMGAQTINESHAVNIAQNLAEGFLGSEGDMDALHALFPEGTLQDGELVLYWDGEWQPCGLKDASYTAKVTDLGYSQGSGLTSADISISGIADEEAIYSLHLDHHLAERRDVQ